MGWEGSHTGVSGTLAVDANRLDEAISRYRRTPSPWEPAPLLVLLAPRCLGAPREGACVGGGTLQEGEVTGRQDDDEDSTRGGFGSW